MAQFQNLILQSQTFDNASWTKTNCTITADNTTAPDGTLTADRINDDGTNGRHDVSQTWSTTPSGWIRTVTFSMYAKAGASSWVQMNNSDVTALTVYFNLSTGTVGTIGTSISEAKMTAAANGFYLCQITFTISATTSAVILHAGIASADATPSYAGGSGTLFYWGAQFVLGNYAPPYAATTTVGVNVGSALRNRAFPAQNLLSQSNDFSQSVWNAVVGTITKTANSLDWTAEGGVGDSIIRHVLSPTKYADGTQFTFSAEIQWVSGASILYCDVNDKTGNAYGDPLTISTDGVRRRYSIVLTCGVGAGGLDLSPKINAGTPSPAMKINIWNAQLTRGNNLGDYVGAVSSQVGSGSPRNITIQAQNLILQSETLGTSPWVPSAASISANTIANPFNGATTADKLVEDGTNAEHYTTNQPTSLPVGSYCYSLYAIAAGRNWIHLTTRTNTLGTVKRAWFNLSTGALGTVQSGLTARIDPVFLNGVLQTGWYRCAIFESNFENGTFANRGVYVGAATGDGGLAYQGDSSSGVNLFGAQVTNSLQPGPYTVTTSATVNTGGIKNNVVQAQNYCLQSETFGTTWSGVSASVSSNAITAPDGTLTADKIVEASSGSTQHRLDQLITTVIGQQYTASVFVKAGERTQVQLRFVDASADVGYDLSTATPFSVTAAGLGYGISAVPGQSGWYRCWISSVATATTTNFRINLSSAGNNSYAGDGTSGLYVWGGCLTLAANNPGQYDSTVRTTTVALNFGGLRNNPPCFQNMILQSQTLDNASWTKTRATISANSTTAPDGTTTADTLIEDNTAGNTHLMTQAFTVSAADIGKKFCGSIYVKAAAGTRRLSLSLSDNTTGDAGCLFDPATGTVVLGALSAGSWTNIGYTVSPVAGVTGWYRVTASGMLGASTTSVLLRCLLDNYTSTSYNGDAASGLYLWGASVSRGTNPGMYQVTVASAINPGSMRNVI